MITFSSAYGADIMMFDPVARDMMELMGKEREVPGVITPDQLPAAIARLKAALAAAHEHPPVPSAEDVNAEDPPVGLAQRIPPLLELLEIALAHGKPVTWGSGIRG